MNVQIKDNVFVTMEDVAPIYTIIQDWNPEGVYLNLYEMHVNSNIDTDVREWASSDKENKHTIADALVIKSMAQKIVGNFYMRFNKPYKPTRLFNDRETAIAWLLSIKK